MLGGRDYEEQGQNGPSARDTRVELLLEVLLDPSTSGTGLAACCLRLGDGLDVDTSERTGDALVAAAVLVGFGVGHDRGGQQIGHRRQVGRRVATDLQP